MGTLKGEIQEILNVLDLLYPLEIDRSKFHSLENTIPKGKICFKIRNDSTSTYSILGQWIDEFVNLCSLKDIDFFKVSVKTIASFEEMYIFKVSFKII